MNKMLIDATHAEETRVVVVDGAKVEEFDFETLNKRQLAGNIYLAKITRVEPSLQAAFVEYGGNRHGFLAFAEIHPDYYQIPAADRQALIEEDRAAAEAAEAEENAREKKSRTRRPAKAETADAGDVVTQSDETAPDDAAAPEPSVEAASEANGTEHTADHGDDSDSATHADDHNIESVAEEDVTEEIRPARKPRARRYKIQEVIKVRQIMLVQVVKEERGNKGAALTTYLSLAGRYCVLMPNTARGGGISRKITNAADRKKLKDIASELEVPKGAGLIIRTAGSQRTRTEIKRDYEYLMRLWEQIRELTFKSVAPAPIYEEGDLIKRQIRDLYSKDIDEVLVEGERGYRVAKDFMKMIMPSHAKNVKLYNDPVPLFARYQVEGYLAGMFNPVVQLKSGGYIVIGITEALVAIDVNSGRATKEGSIEETAYKTNCEAADEIARQLRLRDLAGLIVIDFIDMDERKNNASVEKRFKEKLKTDRARIQVGRISGFGLMEMSRQRLRPGMLESTTQPCAHCHGTGLIRSDDSMALTILRAIEEEGTRKRSREVLVKAPVAVANFLMNQKREHIGLIESRYGMAVRVEADPGLISPDFAVEKFKTATRNVPDVASNVVSVSASLMAQIDEDVTDEVETEDEVVADQTDREDEAKADVAQPESDHADDGSRSKRRRRRRRRGGSRGENGENGENGEGSDDDSASANADAEGSGEAAQVAEAVAAEGNGTDEEPATGRSRGRSRSRSRSRRGSSAEAPQVAGDADAGAASAEPMSQPELEPAEGASIVEPAAEVTVDADAGQVAPQPQAETPAAVAAPKPEAETPAPAAESVAEVAPTAEVEAAPATEAEAEPAPAPEPAAANKNQPDAAAPAKRRGWWSFGG